MTSVLKKSRGTKGKSESMQEDLPARHGKHLKENRNEDVATLIKYIDDNIIGKGNSFCGPFGRRKVVYCDYSGSGRAVQWIEDYVSNDILPTHATQCTAFSYTSGQSDIFRSESEIILRSAVGADVDDVIILGASLSRFLRALKPQRVTLFVSSRETERQIAPWREFNAEVIKIPETKEGFIDLHTLEVQLQKNTGSGRKLVGFFPAASKLTGVLADDVATTLLLHQYGAWSFWDYTLVAPTSMVEMNPVFPGVDELMVKKDAVFFNCEKFVGGIQGPYVAVVKKDVFKNSIVYDKDVQILRERLEEYRCSEAVRAALVMQLRDEVGLQNIAERQDKITRQVLAHIKNIPELILLGNQSPTVSKLPIFSIMVKHPRGTFLHHNFVCAVLNDVFGIQARGGLNSNLSYGQDVLGIDENLLREYEKLLDVEAQKEISRTRKISNPSSPETPIYNEHLRPGFCRVSLPYFMSESELAFVLEAMKMVATEGWKILPQYVVNQKTGQWKHHTCSLLRDRKSLFSLKFQDGKMFSNERRVSGPGIFPQTYTECLQTARNLFNRARKLAMKCSSAEQEYVFNPRIDYLRWFMLPKEAHDLLLGRSANVKHIVPFDPSGYTGARKSLQNFVRSSINASPILGSSPRHFSLSAIDDCHIFRLKQKQKYYSRVSSLKENLIEDTEKDKYRSPPVQFAVGDSMSPVHLSAPRGPVLIRSRCYSLGSEMHPSDFPISISTPNEASVAEKSSFCNCGSQTDLQSLDDPMISPTKAYPYIQGYDCIHVGRTSPTASQASHNSEDLQAYVKEMTKEIATEIKSEIREVISQVDDILENSDSLEQSNLSLNSISSQGERNSVSVIDVAQYLMGMSKEMASEVKHEIREMVNQVDEMISPDFTGNSSRKSSPPHTARRRIGSGPDLGLDLHKTPQCLKKCPTSPILPTEFADDAVFCKQSPKASTQDASGPNSISFSSETSTPDTIIQMNSTQNSPNLPKSLSSNKLSDDEVCADVSCRQCCIKKNWCQNPSISSQDSGINMSFTETDTSSYIDFVKWRTSSDPTTNKVKKLQGRLRMCQRYEKSEVPDIIEDVPVCPGDHARDYTKRLSDSNDSRMMFREANRQNSTSSSSNESKRSSRCSNASSSSSDRSSRSSGYMTDVQTLPSQDEQGIERCESEEWDGRDDSSACSDNSLTEFTLDDDGKWYCAPKIVWKPTVEAIHEFQMIRPGDKVLVCLSGGRDSVALLHTIHQYQFYARAKGIHFSIGALFVHESRSEVDPLHLMAYCRTLGVKFIYQDKIEEQRSCRVDVCARWSSHGVRRGVYVGASTHGYGVVAVAQHMDTAARAFLAALTHHGRLHTVKAHYRVAEHDLRVIRPFIYVRERDIDAFATARMLPDFRNDSNMAEFNALAMTEKRTHGKEQSCLPAEQCDTKDTVSEPIEANEPLRCARELLTNMERSHPCLFSSFKSALHPLISARNIEKDLKENRHRKKSVIQMKNGARVYDSEEGTDEEPVS